MALHTFSPAAPVPILRGRHARLRAPCAADADALFALFSDAATMRWWPRAPMRTHAEAVGYIDECATHLRQGDRIDWVVTTAHDDAAIGTCTLHAIDARRHCAEVGYALRPAYRGRGIATDAVAQVVAWSVRNLGLRRIAALVAPANVPSQRVLERLAFAPTGEVEDGFARWAREAVATDHSRRSAGSR